MSVFINLYHSHLSASKSNGRWFARRIKMGETDLSLLAERIQRNTTFKRGEVHGLLIELVEQMRESLLNGETVVLDGIGRFHLSVRSNMVDRPADFRIDRDVKNVVCKFVPEGRRLDDGTIVHKLAEGAEVNLWEG